MAKETASWTQRIGGNRTLVLGIMISMLVLFTVDYYVVQALGVGNRGGGYIRFTVNGRTVEMDQGRYQTLMSDWQRYQTGQAAVTGRPRGGSEDFLMDLMLSELARDAGLSIPDATLREFIRIHPHFADVSGEFDPRKFEEALKGAYGGMRPRAFEEQARLSLLITHFVTIYDQAYRIVNDEEAWKRWKGDYPKIGIVYTWAGISSIRSAMKVEDLRPEEIEAYWNSAAVKERHRLMPRYLFDAAALTVNEVDDRAYLDAREEWKDDPALQLKKDQNTDEGFTFFFESRKSGFDISAQKPGVVDALRAENEAAVKAEDEEFKKAGGAAPRDPDGTEAVPDLSKAPPESLEDRELYRRYWRHRVEKQLWLKKLFAKVIKAASDGKIPLGKAVEPFSRPGIRIRLLEQDQPVDQYGIERIKGFGNPSCDLRYVMNDKKAEDEGKVHGEVLYMTADRNNLEEAGWLVFGVNRVIPAEVPPLDAVKEKVAGELLDDRARDRARADLEGLRKAAEDSRRSLEEVAREKGFESAVAPPFNTYTWRPPTPMPATGMAVPGGTDGTAAVVPDAVPEGWKDPDRRLAAIMGRYGALRDTPVGGFGPVLDETSGIGAFFLAQVKVREEPAFEEMTQGQLGQVRRIIGRERLGAISQELTYGALKNRFGLNIAGQPAPEPESKRRGR